MWPAMPNSSPASSTYCLHIFVNSVLNNLDLLGFANTIWFLLCRDCDLILKVWLPLLGKLNGSSRWHCTAPARGCNDSEFLAPGRLPRACEWSDGLQIKKGKEDLMIGPPASREAESPSNRVLWVLWAVISVYQNSINTFNLVRWQEISPIIRLLNKECFVALCHWQFYKLLMTQADFLGEMLSYFLV